MRHVGGRERVGDQNLADTCGQFAFFHAGLALQGGNDAADDLVDVFHAAAQIGVVHGLEHAGETIALFLQRSTGAIAADA